MKNFNITEGINFSGNNCYNGINNEEKVEGMIILNRISGVTRRDIFDLLKNGIYEYNYLTEETIYCPYYGRLNIVDFLERIYKLNMLESIDSRCKNAKQEISMHTYNGDYSDDWIFEDKRFGLVDGEDEILLDFLCEIFHPEVRFENKEWKKFLKKINDLLREDGYQLVPCGKLSGRDIFKWRIYDKEQDIYIPFSERSKFLITQKKIKLKLPNIVRHQLFKVMNKYNKVIMSVKETGLNHRQFLSEIVLEEINKFYKPVRYLNEELVEIEEFKDLQKGTSPFKILDILEIFSRYSSSSQEFENEINNIFKLNGISVQLKNGKVCLNSDKIFTLNPIIKFNEAGIENLITIADDLYTNGKYSFAVEKIWDAFERIKTYYTSLDKKKSAEKIVHELSNENENIKKIFENEFRILTNIGNSYCIRHHETNKIDIEDDLHYKYFYMRCYSLISVIIEKLTIK